MDPRPIKVACRNSRNVVTQRSINLEYAWIVDQELREAVFGSHDVHEKLPHLGSAFDELAAIVSIAKIASFSHSCFEGSLQPMGVVSLHDHDAWILVVRLVTTLQCAQCTRPPPKLANVLVDACHKVDISDDAVILSFECNPRRQTRWRTRWSSDWTLSVCVFRKHVHEYG